MNRREFFKFPAVAAFIAVAPLLAKIAAAVPTDTTGFIREIMAYDLYHDAYHIRWDMSDGTTQHQIDYLITAQDVVELGRNDFLIEIREEAILQLKKYAISHGMKNMDRLVRMKLPAFVEHARYV